MDAQEAKEFIEKQNASLVAKGTLLLKVQVSTPEQAGEIMQWLYGAEKPMKATLLEISWDKVAISKEQAEALAVLLKSTK